MPRENIDEATRENWSRRFSKTVFTSLVPFRKAVTSDESKSPTAQLRARRRASAAAEVLLTTTTGSPEISAVHKQRQRRRSADRIYALKSNQVHPLHFVSGCTKLLSSSTRPNSYCGGSMREYLPPLAEMAHFVD